MSHLHLWRLPRSSRSLLLLVVVLALHALSLGSQARREELGRIEVLLYIADDLCGTHTGGFVDGYKSSMRLA